MLSKSTYYVSVDEYVRAMTGWQGKSDSDMRGIAFIWYIVGVLFIARCFQESYPEDGSLGGMLLITFVLPALLFFGGLYFYKLITQDSRALKEKHMAVAKVIDNIPISHDCREVDFAFAELIMKQCIEKDVVLKLKKLRNTCFDSKDKYAIRTRELCTYAKQTDEERKKAGLAKVLQETIEHIEQELRKEEEKVAYERSKELELAKKKAECIWPILTKHYPDIKKETELDAEYFLKLEEEYKKRASCVDYNVFYISDGCGIKCRLCGFIEYFYRLKTARNNSKKIRQVIVEIADNDTELEAFLLEKTPEKMNDEAIFAILGYVLANQFFRLQHGVVIDVLGEARSQRNYLSYNMESDSWDCAEDMDDFDFDDDESDYEDEFSNDGFGYDSEAFDFDMDGFDDHFD